MKIHRNKELTLCWLLFFFTIGHLFSARFIDNRLFFDIFLFDDDRLSIKSDTDFYIEQDTTALELKKSNFLQLEYIKPKQQFYIVTREIVNDIEFRPDSMVINDWSNGKFQIRKIPVSISRSSYSTRERAEVKAKAFHLKRYRINQEPGKVRIIPNNLSIPAIECKLPLTFISETPITVNNQRYNGLITLKDSFNGSLRIINTIEMEEYVAGVIPSEIGTDAPYEALKAQAVAARSQTIFKILTNRHRDDGYDLCSSVHCQVYKGLQKQTESTYRAAIETSGEVLIYQNAVIDAVFHSSCGGRTENAGDVWNEDVPYLRSISDKRDHEINLSNENNVRQYLLEEDTSYCADLKTKNSWYKGSYEWKKVYSVQDLSQKLNIGMIRGFEAIKRGDSGRIIKLKIIGDKGSETINKELAIRAFFNQLYSSFFTWDIDNGHITLYGKGMGHGVGMCQLGAIAQALEGFKYNEILTFYYQNCVLSQSWILDNGFISGE